MIETALDRYLTHSLTAAHLTCAAAGGGCGCGRQLRLRAAVAGLGAGGRGGGGCGRRVAKEKCSVQKHILEKGTDVEFTCVFMCQNHFFVPFDLWKNIKSHVK